MSMLNFLVFTSLKSIRILVEVKRLYLLNFTWILEIYGSAKMKVQLKKSPFQSAFLIVRYVCRFPLITYFDYIAVTVFYQQESCYFRKYDRYIPSPSQCFLPKTYTVLTILCSYTLSLSSLYNTTVTPVLLKLCHHYSCFHLGNRFHSS